MPFYEYDCPRCGLWSDLRSMAESALPAPCPRCRRKSARVLSAASVRHGRGAGRASGGPREPTLVKRSDRPPPTPARQHAHGAARPWMLGH
jgi:putative FmdB family regulatory protein